jgi:hypothetical protein
VEKPPNKAHIARMDQDPIHKCFDLLKSIIETADTSRIPDAQHAVDKYLAVHLEKQQIFAITQLDDQIAGLWGSNPQGDRLVVLMSISTYIGERLKKLEKRNAT